MEKPRKYIKKRFKYRKPTRDYDDPRYKKLRAEVRRRDNYKCQFPGCKCKNRRLLEVHHILRWGDFPSLRYNAENLITICRKHHKFVTGKEIYYAKMFMQIVQNKKKK